jgi:Flp pilus assembly protein TadB
MAKNRYGKMQSGMQGNAQYNRPSGGYQKNVYRQQMNSSGVKQPKGIDQKTFRIIAIAVGVVWIALSVLLILKLKWWGLLISMVIGAAVVGGAYFFIQYKERQMIKYYKQIGMSEEMYIKELRKRNVDKKQIDQVRKTWRKVDADPVVGNAKDPKGGKKK